MLFSISRITKNNTKEQKFRNLQPEFLNQFQADKIEIVAVLTIFDFLDLRPGGGGS